MATIEEIYARIPTVACQRLCQEACGPIPMTRIEYVRLMGKQPGQQLRVPLAVNPVTGACPKLGRDGLCMRYRLRPAICRLFGVIRAMACPWGCVPERWLTDEEARAILLAMEQLDQETVNG